MPAQLSLDHLVGAVAGRAAAFRCRSTLQPAGGPGTKIFPPTFAGAVYAIEKRRLPGRDEPVTCVLLDSVQSQANRMEAALQDAVDAERISIPVVVVDFSPYFPGDGQPEEMRLLDPIDRVTSLQAPHRVADAILRDSEHDSIAFRKSEIGKAIDLAAAQNAMPIYRLCPTALVFGMWDSTGPKGGLGAKFERAMVSEIVGIGICYRFERNEERPKNHGIRRDPLNVSKSVGVRKRDDGWELADGDGKGVIRPSEINHGNVPFDNENAGITIESAEQTTVLSLPVLRRLRFPGDSAWSPTKEQRARDDAARTVLAALALCAAELSADDLDLRSRCLLWPDEAKVWQLLATPGEAPQEFTLGAEAGVELLREAVEAAAKVGVTWESSPIHLTPSESLVKLVRRSQEQAVAAGGDEGGD